MEDEKNSRTEAKRKREMWWDDDVYERIVFFFSL